MKFTLSTLSIFLFSICAWAQQPQKHTVSGTITDAKNGETIFGTIVMVKENASLGTSSNAYGYYSLTLPEGKYTLVVRSIGFTTIEQPIDLTKNIVQDFKLATDNKVLGAVEISSEKEDKNVRSAETVVQMNPKDVEKIPVFMGEAMRAFMCAGELRIKILFFWTKLRFTMLRICLVFSPPSIPMRSKM
jgi:CarboxypepD_reg-like domain